MSETADKPQAKPATDEVERLDAEAWKERAGLLGEDRHVLAGALSMATRKTLSEDDVRKLLKDFKDPRKTPGSAPVEDEDE